MPRPVYIVCAESGVQDKTTNLVSFQNVIERITLTKRTIPTEDESASPKVIIEALRVWAVAVWRKEESDEQRDFEGQFVIVLSNGKRTETPLHKFTFEGRANLHRMILDMRVGGDFPEGLLHIQNRVRATGEQDWLVQEYPIQVDVVEVEGAPPGVGGSESERKGRR